MIELTISGIGNMYAVLHLKCHKCMSEDYYPFPETNVGRLAVFMESLKFLFTKLIDDIHFPILIDTHFISAYIYLYTDAL